jgi:hypothetical protein
MISSHSEQRFPSVKPLSVQVASTAGSTSSVWVCPLLPLDVLGFSPLGVSFPPPQAASESARTAASMRISSFFIVFLVPLVFCFNVRFVQLYNKQIAVSTNFIAFCNALNCIA